MPDKPTDSDDDKSVADDLAQGLGLMFRAAKKAVSQLDPEKVEDLGRRAVKKIESIDREQVQDFGKKAVKNLDPRKIEAYAEDAGRELINVMNKVVGRVDEAVTGYEDRARKRRQHPSEPPPADTADAAAASSDPPPAEENRESKTRVRVDSDD